MISISPLIIEVCSFPSLFFSPFLFKEFNLHWYSFSLTTLVQIHSITGRRSFSPIMALVCYPFVIDTYEWWSIMIFLVNFILFAHFLSSFWICFCWCYCFFKLLLPCLNLKLNFWMWCRNRFWDSFYVWCLPDFVFICVLLIFLFEWWIYVDRSHFQDLIACVIVIVSYYFEFWLFSVCVRLYIENSTC